MKILQIFVLIGTTLSGTAFSFWEDPVQGLDFLLKSGRYPGRDLEHECAMTTRGSRLPEIEELVAAYNSGIADPDLNGPFGETVAQRRYFYSATTILQGAKSLRYLIDMKVGSIFTEEDSTRTFRGLLCAVTPQTRSYWYPASPGTRIARIGGRMTLPAARSSCWPRANEHGVMTINQLEMAVAAGLFDPAVNQTFAAYLLQFPVIGSASLTDASEKKIIGIDPQTGSRQILEKSEAVLFLCREIFD